MRLVCEHDILRLQVAVNDLDLDELLQANQNLLGYLAKQLPFHASLLVLSNVVVHVDI